MGFNKTYRTLFDVKILHHYFLDDGVEVYGVDLDAEKMEKYLAQYSVSSFMRIEPTDQTRATLRNFRSRFVQSNQGFQVLTSADGDEPFIPFSDDLKFDFKVKITDQFFENYTNITINRTTPLFLSNRTPDAPAEVKEGEEPTAISVNFCLLSKFETALTNGSPDPTLPMENIEVDLNDIDSRELIGTFAIIRIHLVGEAGEITLTDVDNLLNVDSEGDPDGHKEFNGTLPEVTLAFENRSTTWKYHQSSDSALLHTTVDEMPLTKHGYISIKDGDDIQYPNPSVNLIYQGELAGEDPAKKYSRTFI